MHSHGIDLLGNKDAWVKPHRSKYTSRTQLPGYLWASQHTPCKARSHVRAEPMLRELTSFL